ncbi:hypothetical protein [Qipengyuania gaetbuli]|uniref:hypothetical protein n=1 Tax=Qipengyuania gaetbuli TaxID=266952 RepID=UPI001CFC5E19|nr:hypothetical protein [Qipengyuania gaetbuli]
MIRLSEEYCSNHFGDIFQAETFWPGGLISFKTEEGRMKQEIASASSTTIAKYGSHKNDSQAALSFSKLPFEIDKKLPSVPGLRERDFTEIPIGRSVAGRRAIRSIPV